MPDDRSEIIRRAFLESIDILGEQGSRALIEDLQRYRVFIYDQDLSIENLASGLEAFLGEEATQALLERVYIKLDELVSKLQV